MQVYRNIDEVNLPKSAITIGFFDGLHLGHQQIIETLKQNAQRDSAPSLLVTFWPHPRIVLKNDVTEFRLLMTLDEKIKALSQMGIDSTLIMDFTPELSQVSGYDFLEKLLVQKLKASTIVVGFNHAFGHKGQGNFNLINTHQTTYGYRGIQVDPIEVDGIRISSTKIRSALEQGDIGTANSMLGRPYTVSGIVENGRKLGRTIGFPTANIGVNDPLKLIPEIGVYAVWAELNGEKHPAMLNIGIRPTVGNDLHLTVEANIINFDRDIYGQELTIHFVERIRDEVKFPSLEALKAQLADDKEKATTILQRL